MGQVAGPQVEGKVAIVTGGASGIGAACARLLAREGAKGLLINNRSDHVGFGAIV